MKVCKTALTSDYLYGDIDLTNATMACNRIFSSTSIQRGWIGVARQVYINRDNGNILQLYLILISVIEKTLKDTLQNIKTF